MLVAFSIAPTTSDPDGLVTGAVADVVRLVRASGLPHRTDAMFTTLEGDWDACMGVIKKAVDHLAATSPRISLMIKADIRPGAEGELTAKLGRLDAALADREPD